MKSRDTGGKRGVSRVSKTTLAKGSYRDLAPVTKAFPGILGHPGSLAKRLNVRATLRHLRNDPLGPLLHELVGADAGLSFTFPGAPERYIEAYEFHYLSLSRYLRGLSLGLRWQSGPYYVWRYGGKYDDNERSIAARYREVARFLHYDFANCLIHARILMDRVAGLARYFLAGPELPSYTSFSDHRKFFLRRPALRGTVGEYGRHIRERTGWFDMPLKEVRDKFIVHHGPKHARSYGWEPGGNDLGLMLMLPRDPDSPKPLSSVIPIVVSIPQLTFQIDEFLQWFCKFGLGAFKSQGKARGRCPG